MVETRTHSPLGLTKRAGRIIASGLAMFAIFSGTAQAHTDTETTLNRPVIASLGSGIGLAYGAAGLSGAVGLQAPNGLGLSVEVGAGVSPAASANLWFPGEKLQLGVGAVILTGWEQLASSFGSSQSQGGCSGPDRDGNDAFGVMGAQVSLDHDIGAPNGFGMRYGLGGALVIAGCAGGILPTPSVGLHYVF